MSSKTSMLKLATTLACMNAVIGDSPYKLDVKMPKIKEEKPKDTNSKFVVKIGKKYIGENGLVNNKIDAFRYASYNVAQEDSAAFPQGSGRVKIVKL